MRYYADTKNPGESLHSAPGFVFCWPMAFIRRLLFLSGRFARGADFERHLQVDAVHNHFAIIYNGRHVVDIGRAQIAHCF